MAAQPHANALGLTHVLRAPKHARAQNSKNANWLANTTRGCCLPACLPACCTQLEDRRTYLLGLGGVGVRRGVGGGGDANGAEVGLARSGVQPVIDPVVVDRHLRPR
jgi:hypothetical protein